MSLKEIFYEEKNNCELEFTHIESGITNPTLKKIDEVYGAADILSQEYQKKHKRNLKLLSGFGIIIIMLFLLYDEAELHLLIFGCIIIMIAIFYTYKLVGQTECHEKYLEYRLLAESLRLQYYLSIANVSKSVSDILPWFIKKGVPWIDEILASLPKMETKEKKHIINRWIREQLEYHQKGYIKSLKQYEKNERIRKIVMGITILTYAAAFIFEIYMLTIPSGEVSSDLLSAVLKSLQDCGIMVGLTPTDMIRGILKIIMGTMSAVTLLTEGYYGKMSLPNTKEAHRRMVMLYEKAENDILQNGETEEIIIHLAREYLIENTTWFAYQKGNEPDITLE